MTGDPGPYGGIRHPYGLPMGTVRGFMSLLICSFFWIYLLLPDGVGDKPAQTAPLAHFFLLTLVFLAFASNPFPHDSTKSEFLPWLLRFLFVGGSLAVLVYVGINWPNRVLARLTPDPADIYQWPVLLATLAGGFAFGVFIRFAFRRTVSELFQTIRGWVGVIAMLLLVAETIFQFLIRPSLGPIDPEALKIWEGTVIAFVAAYFGTRA
jgi:hypothetical protein